MARGPRMTRHAVYTWFTGLSGGRSYHSIAIYMPRRNKRSIKRTNRVALLAVAYSFLSFTKWIKLKSIVNTSKMIKKKIRIKIYPKKCHRFDNQEFLHFGWSLDSVTYRLNHTLKTINECKLWGRCRVGTIMYFSLMLHYHYITISISTVFTNPFCYYRDHREDLPSSFLDFFASKNWNLGQEQVLEKPYTKISPNLTTFTHNASRFTQLPNCYSFTALSVYKYSNVSLPNIFLKSSLITIKDYFGI